MDPKVASPLAQLRDIHNPDPIGFWPIAPGWYLLFFGLLLITLACTILIWKKINAAKPKRQALRLLENYQKKHVQEKNTALTCARVSELLKRVALVYFDRSKIADLQGQAWIDFLNQTGKGVDFQSVEQALLSYPYLKKAPYEPLTKLFSNTKIWIRQRRGPCLN